MEEFMFNMFNNYNGDYGSAESTKNQNNAQTSAVADFETLQKARADLVDEIKAIMQYDDHIHDSNNRLAKETWEDIKNEELNHVGQLLALLDYLDPSQQKFVMEGINEFNDRRKQN